MKIPHDWSRYPTRTERRLKWYNFRSWCYACLIWAGVVALVVMLFDKAEADVIYDVKLPESFTTPGCE